MNQKQFVLKNIKDIAELLDFQYHSPNHNNKDNVLDELVYILLSRRTRNRGYKRVYNHLKKKYPNWGDVATAPDRAVLRIIRPAGLGTKRVKELKDNLNIIYKRFGNYSLERLHKWGNPKVFEFLTSLKGIGTKSAFCIMMYSLHRRVFPVDTHINRISQRLGIIEMGVNHKLAQKILTDMFPENLRYQLHVNMISHGRSICRSGIPSCNHCIIKNYCNFNRNESDLKGNPGFIDLFAGPGGMSLGFEKAGFHLKGAIEYNSNASATFLYNRPNFPPSRVLNLPIQKINPRLMKTWKIKVLVAGPPCQEYSPVRKNGYGEFGRKKLYLQVLRFVRELKPKFVVIENVPGMATPKNTKYVRRVETGLRRHGYEVISGMLNAKEYGIPQSRTRLFFIAKKICKNSRAAARKTLVKIWKDIRSYKKDEKITFLDGVSGLPSLVAGEGRNIMLNSKRGRRSVYAISLSSNEKIIFNHTARKHNPRDLEAFELLKDGENAIALYNKRPDLMPYSIDNFHTKFFKIKRNAPSPTIVAHLKKDANSFIHPIDNRGISPREAARLQSFPDSYRFLGTYGVSFEQIGNAVPPLLAEIIAKSLLKEIRQNKWKGGLK